MIKEGSWSEEILSNNKWSRNGNDYSEDWNVVGRLCRKVSIFSLFMEAIDEKGDRSHFQTVHQTSTSSGLNNLFGPKLQARPCSSCAPPDTSSPSKGGAGSCLTQWYRDQSQAISRNKDGGVGHRQDIQPGLDYCSPYSSSLSIRCIFG